MKKGILLTILALMCQLAIFAQNYDRYNFFHDEAVKLKNEGKLNEAKEKFKKIKVICRGGIPENNDLDKMIRECTTISLSESEIQLEATGKKPKSVTVRTNADSFRANSSMEWCKAAKKGNTVSVSCDNNDSPDPRSAIVTVVADGKSASFDVIQIGGVLKFEARPDSVRFSKLSETVDVAIFTNATSWRVDSVPDWIEFQSNDTMLYLTSEQNPMARVREATVFLAVADERFPIAVRQAESDTTISTDKEELVFPCTESEAFVMVTSNLNQWQVLPSDDWIQVSFTTNSVKVQVQPNQSLFSRHGWVKVGMGQRFCKVDIHQFAFGSTPPVLESEIKADDESSKGTVAVNSIPSDLKVTIIDEGGEASVRYTPFEIPIDYGYYSLQMGFDHKEVFANERQQDVLFEPGLRFASITWAPSTALGMMSGFVSSKSWGAFAHFQANTPFVSSLAAGEGRPDLAGYNMTFGPVFRHNAFPYLGAYVGLGLGGYVKEPHFGIDYEAGLMGFYKNVMLTMGFHTTRVINSDAKKTSFVIGVGGYLKRYRDPQLGYCSSDSRRWFSVNYVFRPSENGKGFMLGDLGKDKVRVYVKALYLATNQIDSILNTTNKVGNIEGAVGVVFTPVNGLIDMCVGASGTLNVMGLDKRFQGFGAELGVILNVWRFPISVFFHEADLFGERHFCLDFGIGFHLGEFEKSKSSYQ